MVRGRALSLVALLAATALGGCGASRDQAPPPRSSTLALGGSPPPLAALHAQANRLLTGGTTGFKAFLARLHGYPVVVNKWASWCGPCTSEFPAFARAALAYGRKVAFVGLDAKDANPSAAAFLRRFPVSYPSFVDPGESIARVIQAANYFPQTIYFDRNGRIVYDHAGPYESAGALERDIRRYALG